MKTILIAVLLLVATVASGAKATKYNSGIANAFDKEVAGKTLDGHFVQDMCSVYAQSLCTALEAKGIKSTWVAIKWKGIELGHSFVVFEKGGKLWAIDNMMRKPVKVSAKTDLAIAKKLFALRTNLTVEKVCHPMLGLKSNAGENKISDLL